MKEENWVANVFVVNKEKLAEAISLALSELAKADEKTAMAWSMDYLTERGYVVQRSEGTQT